MNQKYLMAAEQAFLDVLASMGGITANMGSSHEKQDSIALVDDSVTGVISLNSEEIHFSVALTFPKAVIVAIAKRMLQGMSVDDDHPIIADLAGEMANMVVGGAKNRLDEGGCKLSLSLPVIVCGHDYHVEHKTDAPVWVSTFDTDFGVVYMESSYQD